MSDNNLAFDSAYWAAQPPQVKALAAIENQDERTKQAAELAVKGFTIDVPIMVWNWDPWKVMNLRKDFGYTWVPAALQPAVQIAPGLSFPGTLTPYDPQHPPSGSIKVSTDIADYPAYVDPTSLPVPVITDFVGAKSVGNLYLVVSGDHTPDGTTVTNSRGNFVKHLVQTPFGYNAFYEKVA